METSDVLELSAPAVASPDGKLIATLDRTSLQVRTVPQLQIIRDLKAPQELHARKRGHSSSTSSSSSSTSTASIRWAPWRNCDTYFPTRLLLANDQYVWAYDLDDERWSATIDNGSASMGGIVSVDFGASDTEVIVFSDYSSKVTVWSLESGRAVEIKDPKFSYLTALSLIKLGFGYRPKFCKSVAGPGGGGAGAGAGAGSVNANSKVGVFALLARSAAQDILLLLAPQSYSILKSVPLCTTDAQGIKWSPDGRWLAVWEAASVGYKVYIYTADGNLYRVYGGNISEDGPEEGRITAADRQALGVGSIEWSPKGDSLAIGDHARRVTLLNIRTFSPVVFLEHTGEVQLSQGEVWEEQIHPSGHHSYALSPQPVHPPSFNNLNNHHSHVGPISNSSAAPSSISASTTHSSVPRTGVSLLTFNSTGSFIATREDTTPTTVWIWNINDLTPRAVLIHGTPVKSLKWHPSDPQLLLIQCFRETTGPATANLSRNSRSQSQSQPQPQSKAKVPIYLWHNTDGPAILYAPSLTAATPSVPTSTTKSSTKTAADKFDKPDNADLSIRWLRTDTHAPPSISTFSFSSSLNVSTSPNTATSNTRQVTVTPRILLTTPHACTLVGIPTLDNEAHAEAHADATANSNDTQITHTHAPASRKVHAYLPSNRHARNAADTNATKRNDKHNTCNGRNNSNHSKNVNENDNDNDNGNENENDISDNDNERMDDTLDNVSFASFDFTAGPSAFLDDTRTVSQMQTQTVPGTKRRHGNQSWAGDSSVGFDGEAAETETQTQTVTDTVTGGADRLFDGTTSTVNYEDEFF